MQLLGEDPPGVDHEFEVHGEHTVDAEDATYVPAGHGKHGDDPFAGLYVPIAHGMHGPPSDPLYPGLHVQRIPTGLPSADHA